MQFQNEKIFLSFLDIYLQLHSTWLFFMNMSLTPDDYELLERVYGNLFMSIVPLTYESMFLELRF